MALINTLILCLSIFIFNFILLAVLGSYLVYQIVITKKLERELTKVYDAQRINHNE